MTPTLRFASLSLAMLAAGGLGIRFVQSAGAPDVDERPLLIAVEYRTATQPSLPIPSATENVLLHEVPEGSSFVLRSFLLPHGVPVAAGSNDPIEPRGLGLQIDAQTVRPLTVPWGQPWDLKTLDPGIPLGSGAKLVLRFDQPVKGLAGSLLLNGVERRP